MHSEKFKLDFRTKMLMSLCLSYTLILGNIQTKFSIGGGSLFAAAICIFTLEQGKGKRR